MLFQASLEDKHHLGTKLVPVHHLRIRIDILCVAFLKLGMDSAHKIADLLIPVRCVRHIAYEGDRADEHSNRMLKCR